MEERRNEGVIGSAIKEKMEKSGEAKFVMPTLKKLKVPTHFWASEDGEGILTDKLSRYVVLKWEHFDAIVKKANSLGGRIYRGDDVAQSGGRLGADISENTIEGYVSMVCDKLPYGEKVTRRSTYYAGILAWAGIAEMHRSEGRGSYISITEPYRHA